MRAAAFFVKKLTKKLTKKPTKKQQKAYTNSHKTTENNRKKFLMNKKSQNFHTKNIVKYKALKKSMEKAKKLR